MCGIIGYVGRQLARPLILAGLERLEYRGYDSAGIGLIELDGELGRLVRVRATGGVAALSASLNGHGATARTGIGHTRWATHGRVCEQNAHPFLSCDGSLALALNGIVENFRELRATLSRDGHCFSSETDAEVVCHLVEHHYKGDLVAAVSAAAAELDGRFALVCCHEDAPELLVATRRECPLVVGVGRDGIFVASSTTAFLRETRRIQAVEDGDVVAATPAGVRFFADRLEVERPLLDADWADEWAGRGEFESFMLKEIHEQPQALRQTLEEFARAARAHELPPYAQLRETKRVLLLACGTSYHAALAGRGAIEAWASVPCDVEIASEWRYRQAPFGRDTLVVGVSQSGETADTLAALRRARELGLPTLAITNMPGSQITREADATLYTRSGIELAVAATKTFTAQIVLLAALSLALGEARGSLERQELDEATTALRELAAKAARHLSAEHPIAQIAARCAEAPFFLFLGRELGLPVCLEGALKLREIGCIPCEAYPAGEMKHGPIALIDEGTPVIVVATRSSAYPKLLSNIEEVRARGAYVVAVADESNEALQHDVDDVLYVPRTHPLLQPVLAVLPLQLLAYEIARLRGLDPDRPRNLAKTVTVE
jgi:glucosamine--fructose-6-phosphate aminotransferase (isomerizing)